MKSKRITVNDFINIASENRNLIICDCIGKELTKYDGKNSIDKIYLNDKIMNVTTHDNDFIVYLEK